MMAAIREEVREKASLSLPLLLPSSSFSPRRFPPRLRRPPARRPYHRSDHALCCALACKVGEDVFLLGCGAPLGPCIGHVDAMRVSADAAPHWLPRVSDLPLVRSLFTADRTNMPAARNMVRNTAVRMQMGGRLWRNDPDCLILRDAGADFTLGQAQALATTAALSAGALIFSDVPSELSPSRLALLQALLPPLPRAAVAADLLLREVPAPLAARSACCPTAARRLPACCPPAVRLLSAAAVTAPPRRLRRPTAASCSTLCGAQVPAQLVLPLSHADLPLPASSPLGRWWLVALFNWSDATAVPGGGGASVHALLAAADATDTPPSVGAAAEDLPASGADPLREGAWHAFDFWAGEYTRLEAASLAALALRPSPVPPRCCSLLALRRVAHDGGAQLVGSSVHCSCGLETRLWRQSRIGASASVLEIALDAGRAVRCPRLWIHLPGTTADRPPTEVSAMADILDVADVRAAPPDTAAAEPSIEWVADEVWVLSLTPIGPTGQSDLHRIVF